MSHLKSVPSVYDPMSVPYNYKFGGKELQETGFYDFGARNYMPDLGRWFNIDPLAELRPDLTPFRYAFNNPVSYTDPTGMYEDGGDDGEYCRCEEEAIRTADFAEAKENLFRDLEAEYREETQDVEAGFERRKQRDIEDATENAYLDQQLAREKQDIRGKLNYLAGDPTPYLTNNSNHTIYFKPEKKMVINGVQYDDGGSYALAPGQSWYYPIDGIAASHIKNGQVYKVLTGVSASVNDNQILLGFKNAGFFSTTVTLLDDWLGTDSFGHGKDAVYTGGWKDGNWLREISAKVIINGSSKAVEGMNSKNWINLFYTSGLQNAFDYKKTYNLIRK